MASLGFLTFGANASGLILNNYSSKDTLMSVSRMAVAASIVFSYPLAFVGARDGVLDLFKLKNPSEKLLNGLTVGMLSALTIAALSIPDVSFVLAFAGATLGNALIYIFPAIMFRGAIKKLPNPTKLQKAEVKFSMASAVFGLIMGGMGAFKALQTVL
jgi:amino acid permease